MGVVYYTALEGFLKGGQPIWPCEGDVALEAAPLKTSVKAEGHTPQYKMHKYFARRPYTVFRHIINHYTQKGDVVLDCFCGGGVTVFEAAALGRYPIGVDINPLAAFVTRMQMFCGRADELEILFRDFLAAARKKYGDWYDVSFCDDEGAAAWFEWVYTVSCPECGEEIELLEKNKVANGIYRCPNTGCTASRDGVKRVLCVPGGSRPVRVKYLSAATGKTVVRAITEDNITALKKYDYTKIVSGLTYAPDFDIPKDWDRRYEDKLYEKGVRRYRHFFTERNYALNCLIFNDIMQVKECMSPKLNEYLYFLFSSALRYTNRMTRVTDKWEGGKPTAMDKHAFWLPNQYVENNILDVLESRAAAIIKGCTYSSKVLPGGMSETASFNGLGARGGYMVLAQSASALPIPNEAVDVIITDPPYGSNVQYAELSAIWNAWYAVYGGLSSYIYKEREAVLNRKDCFEGSKTVTDYENLLYGVFSEGARVLKPDGYLVFTFNNKNIKVWVAMLKAVARAGFYLPLGGIVFQDGVESYKNTAHLRFSGNIHGDFIYSFKKGIQSAAKDGEKGFSAVIQASVDECVANYFTDKQRRTTAELYSDLLTRMTAGMMRHIFWCAAKGRAAEDISALPDDYIDRKLRQALIYEDGVWMKGQTV